MGKSRLDEKVKGMDKSDWGGVGLAILVVLGLAISSVYYPNYLYSNRTPEGALYAFIDCVNNKDMNGAANLTVNLLGSEEDSWKMVYIIERSSENIDHITISKIIEIENYLDCGDANFPFLWYTSPWLRENFDNPCCIINADIVIIHNEQKDKDFFGSFSFVFINVDNRWYLFEPSYTPISLA